MRLPNVKTLLCWPSRMQIYGSVKNHTFLEQFVRMGVPAQFVRMGVPALFSIMRVPAQFSNLGVPGHFFQYGGTSTLFQSGGYQHKTDPKNGPQNSSPQKRTPKFFPKNFGSLRGS